MARKVRIELILDADGVVQGFGRVGDEVEGVNDALAKSRKRLSTFKKVLGAAFFAVAARGAARFARRMFQLGSSVEETGSKFNTVFGEMAGSVDEFGESFANMAGLTKREFQDIASVTASILQGLGADLATSAAETQRVLTLAADLASFNNVSIQEAFAAIRSGLIGESEPLKRFGIVLTESETKLRALNTTGKSSEKQLTNLEKAQARLNIITKNAGVALGDLERTQSSAANESKRFNAVVREQEELLATALLPALNDVRKAFSEIIVEEKKAVQDSITFLGQLASIIVKMFGTALGSLSNFLGVANLKFQVSLATTERLVAGALRGISQAVLIVNNSLGALGFAPVESINRLAASAENAAGFLDDVAKERIRAALEAIGVTSEKAAGGVDQLTESLGGTSTGAAGGGGGGGAGAKKGLKGIVETLNDEIKKLAFHVRDLTQADVAEVGVLLAKVATLERELFFRKQLLGLTGGPTEPEQVEGRGADVPSPSADDATKILGERLEAHEEMVDGIMTAEDALLANQAQNLKTSIGFISQHFRQVKAFAVAEAIANTFSAANAALASAPPPLNFILMAATIAAGLANVSAILSASPGGGVSSGAGSRTVSNTTSSQGVALAGIRVQDQGFTTGVQGAALGARAPMDLRIEVIEKDLFTINVLLKNADGVRAQVGSI